MRATLAHKLDNQGSSGGYFGDI